MSRGGGRPSRRRVRVGRAVLAVTALALAGLAAALSGCESTQEKSAHLEAAAKREKAEHPEASSRHGLSIAHASTQAHVTGATVVRDSEGAAAAVTVANDSPHTLTAVPIAITVRDAGGRIVYQNNTPGLESALTEVPSIPAHGTVTWVDDQVSATGESAESAAGKPTVGESAAGESAAGGSATGAPASVSATVGEAQSPTASGGATSVGTGEPEPHIEALDARLTEASTGETTGTVHNASAVAQRQLVVYVIARRGAAIVAAGRAEISELAAGASVPFHAFLIGSSAGARIEADAPASTFG